MPNIALVGSGGGERAMLGLLGSLVQLKKCDLLDCILYLCGTSGSTWCMASLYKEPDWSTHLNAVLKDIMERLGAKVSLQDAWTKLHKYHDEPNFSLTHVWAVMFVSMIVKEIDENTISNQKGNHSKDPYPIYTVIDKQYKQKKLNQDAWFEITPHEAGYSVTGAFVDSAYFGSQFKNGNLIKKQPEIDMLYLQGLCGSALADKEKILKWFWEKIRGKWDKPRKEMFVSAQGLLHERRHDILKQHTLTIFENFEDWFETSEKGASFISILNDIIRLLKTWTWGTTYNFLYKMEEEDVRLSVLSEEKTYYEDAGLLNNSPYFPMLRKERDIDLIISLDFSAGDPMETVINTSEMCRDLKIPFPEVKLPRGVSEPDDFYLFEGENGAPTVIHIPLFNKVNCDGHIKEWVKRYRTFQSAYSHDMMIDLIEKAGENVKNNKARLVTAIREVIEKKKAKAC
ncbi:cytosolic phospholipase A2 gamma-like [Chanos chanos]|uniref:Cytosolic phospholipase A2 gamma-like n=1 Tax=Chanos chanos TaxID=29144 RepID=A0A6J2WG22_CHACN|nr:cytosolic phospholipase A2 gamma-like [Chanos chanos]